MNNKIENTKEKSVAQREVLTLYFDTKLVDQIDDFIHQNKKNLPLTKRKQLSRTKIVGIILQDVFDEWGRLGNNSYLFRLLSKWIDE